jgi:hypothetical protein
MNENVIACHGATTIPMPVMTIGTQHGKKEEAVLFNSSKPEAYKVILPFTAMKSWDGVMLTQIAKAE